MKFKRLCVSLVCLIAYGCGSSTPAESEPSQMGGMDGSGCMGKSDCSGELVCVSGTCVLPQCTVDQECSDDLKCVEFRCRFLGEADGGTTPVQPDTDSMVEPPMNEVDAGVPVVMDARVASADAGTEIVDSGTASQPDASMPDANPFSFDSTVGAPDSGVPMGGNPAQEVDAAQPAMGGDSVPGTGGAVEPVMGGAPGMGGAIEPPPECILNIDCPVVERCQDMVCVPRCGVPAAQPCAMGFICNMGSGECEAIQGCPQPCGEGFRCDELERRCVAAQPEPEPCDAVCPAGFVCHEMSNTCRINNCIEDRFAGNDQPNEPSLINLGVTGNLALCTDRDWFRFVVPPSDAVERVSLKVSADFAPEGSNLELSVYPGDFVPGQQALAEATTDNRPEVLIIDDVRPGSFVLKVDQFRPLGAAVQSLTYDLKIELSDYGFCSDDDECDAGFVCGEGVCIEDPDPCAGLCSPLEVCDAETAECIERCEPDRYEGLNSARETAQFIVTGRVEDLTICDGESDWYRLPIQEPTKLVVEVIGLGDPANNDVQLELWSSDQNLVQENPEDPPVEPLARSAFANQLNEKVEYRFEQATTALIRVYARERARYSLTTTVGESCAFDWDCCPVGVLACNRRCDPVRTVCITRVCGVDYECDAPLVCNAQRTECVRPDCVEDVYGGQNINAITSIEIPADGALANMTTCARAEDWYSVALGAGDGIRLNLDFVNDGFASYDLELRSDGEVLHRSATDLNQESLEYNVDDAGQYFIRVYGALEGQYDLNVDVVAGGIEPLECSENKPCGLNRICQPGQLSVCVEETCLGANANVVCQRGYVCDNTSGQCVCENPDQFEELNDSPQTAAVIAPGFQGALTLCGSETDWFSFDVAQFQSVTLRLSTNDPQGLEVSILDAQFQTISDHNIFGNDRIILDPMDAPAYIEVRSKGDPRALDYGLELIAE